MNNLSSAQAVTELVRGLTLRVRTGILLLEPKSLGTESSIAAKLDLEFVDYRVFKLQRLGAEQRYLNSSAHNLLEDIETIVATTYLHSAILLTNLDLPLAYLSISDRSLVWNALQYSFSKRLNGLVIAMPNSANKLLPSDQEFWKQQERIALL